MLHSPPFHSGDAQPRSPSIEWSGYKHTELLFKYWAFKRFTDRHLHHPKTIKSARSKNGGEIDLQVRVSKYGQLNCHANTLIANGIYTHVIAASVFQFGLV